MTFSDPIHIEFCISSDMKWVAIGCWSDGAFGLFSLLTKGLVWSTTINTSNNFLLASILLKFSPPTMKFDASNTKLVVNTCNTLYVFTPPCLVEGYELEFQSISVDFAQVARDSRTPLNIYYQCLLSKHVLMQALCLQHKLKIRDQRQVLDIAISRIRSSLALLIRRPKWLKVVHGSFETIFASTFKYCFDNYWSRDALPSGLVMFKVVIPSLPQSPNFLFQQPVWIFLFPNEAKDEDSFVVFLPQNGLLGVFIDGASLGNQDQVPFGNHECFALTQSEDISRVFCLHALGIMIIDLSERTIVTQVTYKANLAQWLVPYIKTWYCK